MSALAQEFDGPQRLRVFSIVGTSFGTGLSLGPVAAGLMIEAFGWRSIFLCVVVLAGFAFSFGLTSMKNSRDPTSIGLDWAGAGLFTAALSLFTYGVLLAPSNGWSDPSVVGLIAGAIFFLVLFILVESRVTRPMLDLSLFRYPRFIGVQLLAAAPAYGFVVLLILLPARFIGVEGMSEVTAGALMIALSAPLLILPIAAGMLTRWLHPATICGTGLLITAAGLFWLAHVPVGAPAMVVAMPMLLIGTGISLPWGLMDGLAVSVVPKERAGMATGIFSTTRVAGEGVALAVVAALQSALIAGRMDSAHLSGDIAVASQRLVTGNLTLTTKALSGSANVVLLDIYGKAFGDLLLVLAGITVATAVVVFVFLRRGALEETF
jgi:Major Facilitator Superfamily